MGDTLKLLGIAKDGTKIVDPDDRRSDGANRPGDKYCGVVKMPVSDGVTLAARFDNTPPGLQNIILILKN